MEPTVGLFACTFTLQGFPLKAAAPQFQNHHQ